MKEASAIRTLLSRWANVLGPAAALLVLFAVFSAGAPESFPTTRNVETIARQSAIVATAALGMTLVIVSGGIDLSVGSVIALTTVMTATLLRAGAPPLVAALLAVATAGVCGLANGVAVAWLRVVPFIVTLGSMLVVRGVSKGVAGEQKVDAELTWLNDLLASLPAGQRWMLLPPGVWLALLLAALTAGVLRFTRFGRHAVAIGSNEPTARLCGVPVARTKVLVYTLAGLLSGVAGVLQFSRLTVGDPTVALGLELDVVAAVVIGGGSLSGGEGTVLGSLLGAGIMAVIRAGCSHMGVPNWVQEIITGGVIVLAVALDRLRHRRVS